MLALEVEKDKLKLDLKDSNKKDSRLVRQLKADITEIENKEHILRHLIDTIAWQLISGQLYIARRLYQNVKGEKRLLKSNITSAIIAADQFNQNPLDFALITDLSAYIQSGDLLLKKGDGTMVIVELKEGEKNHEILSLLEEVTQSKKPVQDILDDKKLDEKSLRQLDRNLRQHGEMLGLVQVLNTDEGTDKTGKQIKIVTPKEDTPRFDDVLHALYEQLKTRELWAYNVVDQCLHIGLYKGPLRFMGSVMLEAIGKHGGYQHVIVDYLSVIRSLHKPLLMLPFPRPLLFDILFGRIRLIFMLNIDKYMELFSNYGLKAEWESRKETMKIVEGRKSTGLFIYKGRCIKVTDLDTSVSMYLNVGILGKMYFEHIYPSYTAYTCHYFLHT